MTSTARITALAASLATTLAIAVGAVAFGGSSTGVTVHSVSDNQPAPTVPAPQAAPAPAEAPATAPEAPTPTTAPARAPAAPVAVAAPVVTAPVVIPVPTTVAAPVPVPTVAIQPEQSPEAAFYAKMAAQDAENRRLFNGPKPVCGNGDPMFVGIPDGWICP